MEEVKLNYFQRLFGHLKTVHDHRKLVRKYCFKCGLYYQGIVHDLSKYSPSELIESVKYYQGYRSPYTYERELFGYAPGWLHHKGRNKHHYEYWTDVKQGNLIAIKMPYKYMIESICDRVAASRTYEKDKYTNASALNYFLTRSDAKLMNVETAKQMQEILESIKENGEDETFAKIKKIIKSKNYPK